MMPARGWQSPNVKSAHWLPAVWPANRSLGQVPLRSKRSTEPMFRRVCSVSGWMARPVVAHTPSEVTLRRRTTDKSDQGNGPHDEPVDSCRVRLAASGGGYEGR